MLSIEQDELTFKAALEVGKEAALRGDDEEDVIRAAKAVVAAAKAVQASIAGTDE